MMRRSYNLIPVLALVLLGACQGSRSALEPASTDIVGMEDASVVGDLLIGGQPNEQSLTALANEGYRSVLTVRGEGEIDWDEERHVLDAGMSFQRIDMSNPVNEITDEQVAAFAQFMEDRDGPALIHCGSGNRVAGLWAAWLIEYRNVELDEALSLARKAGMRESVSAVVEMRANDRALLCAEIGDCPE